MLTLLVSLAVGTLQTRPTPIDRHALVTRHNVVLTEFDGERPLQVGNGEFAFGMDSTGLQTFVPFNTMSHWGWHSGPLPAGVKIEDYEGQVWDTHGRPVRYPMEDPKRPELSGWLAGNPHRINLGRVGLVLTRKDGSAATSKDLRHVHQQLDLWTGLVESRFDIEGQPVVVVTACHPSLDAIAAKIESPLIKAGRLAVFLDCPGDSPAQFANFVGDWNTTDHLELLPTSRGTRADLVKRLDQDVFHTTLQWSGKAVLHRPAPVLDRPVIVRAEYGAEGKWLDVTPQVAQAVRDGQPGVRADNQLAGDPILGVPKTLKVDYLLGGKQERAEVRENELLSFTPPEAHRRYVLRPDSAAGELSFTCVFSKETAPRNLPNAAATFAASRQKWPKFWMSGGAIDLSGSRDPRWRELERRIVLSQYLMEVNEAGSLPPQESGLVNNGWFGRFHMEMFWWHASHWALWNRWSELDRSLGIYKKLLPQAKRLAKSEGYNGARWPKCIGPDGREWPHQIHALLIWQQPHPIFFAELDYRAHPTRETLEKWRPIVEATADFLASYAFYDQKSKRYVLGPPLVLVSENTDAKTTSNPTFELGYWRFGLRVAQEWRTRLGLPRRPSWDKVLGALSPLLQQEGVYVLHEDVKDMWTKWNFEHPALTGAFGMLPGDGVDRTAMRRTLDKVATNWDFGRTWGWDFPMLAMCAARIGEPARAVDFLLDQAPGFQFDVRGLATGGPFPYFPSNGGLLYAVALMAAGWDGAPKTHAPGFPDNGQWKVRWEGLSPAP